MQFVLDIAKIAVFDIMGKSALQSILKVPETEVFSMKNKLRSQFNKRQYMLSEDYELFYYSDLQFKSVGLHSHSYFEVYFFTEGDVSMEVGGRMLRLSPGDVLVVPPNTPHRAVINDGSIPYRRFVLWLSQKYCKGLPYVYRYLLDAAQKEGGALEHFSLTSYNLISGRLFTILDEINSSRFGREEKIALELFALILHLSRSFYEKREEQSTHESSLYESVSGYIDTHLAEDLSLDALAGQFYVSKYHISHIFKQNTGQSLHRYIVKRRLEASLAAIRSGASAGEACIQNGFSDYSSFYRAFVKEYGFSPSSVRPQIIDRADK